MKSYLLSQFDVICIIPLWIGNNEISLINLSLTVMFVVLIKTELNKLYSNLEVLRNFQVMSILKFSISDIVFGGSRYLSKLNKIQVLKVKKVSKINFYDSDSIYNSIQHHPFIPNIIYINNKFFIKMSNLTTKSKNAIFIANNKELHSNSDVFLYNESKFINLDDKNKVVNIMSQLMQANENKKLSNVFNNDLDLNLKLISYLDNQINIYFNSNDYIYFEKDLDIIHALNEVKKIVD